MFMKSEIMLHEIVKVTLVAFLAFNGWFEPNSWPAQIFPAIPIAAGIFIYCKYFNKNLNNHVKKSIKTKLKSLFHLHGKPL